jgi:DNA-binding CsgD family transcriptional regulator
MGVITEVISRDEEIAALRHFFESAEELPAALLLEGEPGIGKTMLWRAALEQAALQGFRVLAAAPAAAETRLSFAALADLLEPALSDVLPILPEPQRHALEVALLLAEPDGSPRTARAVAVGLLGALRALASQPLLVAVDDVQWLDEASSAALSFATRRLRDERIAILLTRRTADVGGLPPDPLGVGRSSLQTRRLEIGPLSLNALHHLLRGRLGTTFTRPTLRRLHETSGGNPFYALEIARVLNARGLRPTADDPLPIPDTLDEILAQRVGGLSARVRRVALLVSAASQPTTSLLRRAVGRDSANAGIAAGVETGILELDGNRIGFTHPLLASVAYSIATAQDRRAAHRLLSRTVRDSEERALHLARSTSRPNEKVAAALERAAPHAVRRGAPETAASLAQHAARLTPSGHPHEQARRRLVAADALYASGEGEQARALLRASAGDLSPGRTRAKVLLHLADYTDERAVAIELCRGALAEAAGDLALEAWIHRSLTLWLSLTDLAAASVHAKRAVELADEVGDPNLSAHMLTTLGLVEGLRGGERALQILTQAVLLERERIGLSITYGPRLWLGVNLLYRDDLVRARRILEDQHRRAVERGDENEQTGVLLFLSELEWRAGNWELAARYADDGWQRAQQLRSLQSEGRLAYAVARVAAHQGLIEDARKAANEGLALATQIGDSAFEAQNRTVLGFIELSLEEPQRANQQLLKAVALTDAVGIKEPSVVPAEPMEIEALVALGELQGARDLLARFEARGHKLRHPWALATSARCRGLLAAAGGDLDTALSTLEGSLEENQRLPEPFERARFLLVLGGVLRRANRRLAAREALGEALRAFEELGAPLWAQKARRELARIGGRTATGAKLTATEERVAALVARGLTNKAVAGALFVTDRTVEGHLSRIYAKLGIRSRVELARRFALRS